MAKTKTAKIRKLLSEGVPIKEVIKRVKCSPSMAYNVRSQLAKQETGINSLHKQDVVTSSGIPTLTQNRSWRNSDGRTTAEGEPKPKLSFWQRITEWFKGY